VDGVRVISWHSFDLRTGRRGPQLVTQTLGSVARTIGEASDGSLTVLCWDQVAQAAVPGWDSATLPGRTMLVALDENEGLVWGGMVTRRRSDETAWVGCDLVTLEGYFDRRYVKDHTYTATSQGAIVSGILTADVIPTGVAFTIDAVSSTPRDRTYVDDDDKTALSILQELMGVDGGPEFTVDLQWANDAHTFLTPIVRVRDRVGASSAVPDRFEMPGPVTGLSYVEDFTSDNGANDILATSSGEGDTRPESQHAVATDLLAGGWARFENRFEPSTSITNTSTLDAHATARLATMRDGLAELTLTARLDQAPRPGVDFYLGDDVTASLTCARFPVRIGPDGDLIPGYVKTIRCVGYAMDFDANTLDMRAVEVE
jgi:hypothetical protein